MCVCVCVCVCVYGGGAEGRVKACGGVRRVMGCWECGVRVFGEWGESVGCVGFCM